MLARRLSSGTIIAHVICVRAVNDESYRALARQRAETVVQFRLAKVAARRRVLLITRVAQLIRANRLLMKIETLNDVAHLLALVFGKTLALSSDAERVFA